MKHVNVPTQTWPLKKHPNVHRFRSAMKPNAVGWAACFPPSAVPVRARVKVPVADLVVAVVARQHCPHHPVAGSNIRTPVATLIAPSLLLSQDQDP
jgi:hypothetical protein